MSVSTYMNTNFPSKVFTGSLGDFCGAGLAATVYYSEDTLLVYYVISGDCHDISKCVMALHSANSGALCVMPELVYEGTTTRLMDTDSGTIELTEYVFSTAALTVLEDGKDMDLVNQRLLIDYSNYFITEDTIHVTSEHSISASELFADVAALMNTIDGSGDDAFGDCCKLTFDVWDVNTGLDANDNVVAFDPIIILDMTCT